VLNSHTDTFFLYQSWTLASGTGWRGPLYWVDSSLLVELQRRVHADAALPLREGSFPPAAH